MDDHWGRDATERTSVCGPFASDGADHGDGASPCWNVRLTVDHPEVENAQYDVEITYPRAAAEQTMTAVLFCTSDLTRQPARKREDTPRQMYSTNAQPPL